MKNLRNMEVVNCKNGKRIGYVEDVAVSIPDGRIAGIDVLPDSGKCFSMFKTEPIRIAWCQISRLGEDVILVNYCPDDFNRCSK